MNPIADFISRHTPVESEQYMTDVPCPLRGTPISWRQVPIPGSWLQLVSNVLSSSIQAPL
eukprot:39296-Eustigmatos_ZCMA.PRE.1